MYRLKSFGRGISSPDRITSAIRRLSSWAGPFRRTAQRVPVARRVVAVEIGLVLVLAALSAEFLWLVLTPAALSASSGAVHGAPRTETSLAARANAALLTTTDLFHRATIQVPGSSSIDVDAPETLLNLTLFGVRSDSGADGGSAIIGTPDSAQDVYVLGQEVVNGVRLEHVLHDRVIIRRNGVTESLFLDKGQVAKVSDANTARSGVQETIIRSRIDTGIADLFSQIQLQPRDSGPGAVVQPRGDSTLLQQAGLVAGDVLLAVNGTPVGGIESLAALAGTLKSADEIVLKLERDGRAELRRIVVDR